MLALHADTSRHTKILHLQLLINFPPRKYSNSIYFFLITAFFSMYIYYFFALFSMHFKLIFNIKFIFFNFKL